MAQYRSNPAYEKQQAQNKANPNYEPNFFERMAGQTQALPTFNPQQAEFNPWGESSFGNQATSLLGEQRGFGQFQKEAMQAPGTSSWEALANKQAMLGAQNLQGQAGQQAAAQAAEQRARLAMQGGLTSGARERLAQAAARGGIESRQQAARQSLGQQADIGQQAEIMRRQQLAALPGMEQARSQFQLGANQADYANMVGLRQALNQQNLQNAQMANQARATQMLAQAQAKPPPGLFGGTGFLGLF